MQDHTRVFVRIPVFRVSDDMNSEKGRANPDAQTKLRLFSDAAGHCQRPGCRRPLFSDEKAIDYHIAEMAHIFAATDGGPRTKEELDDADRAKYENLILLCPSCHTEIDKAPESFPDTLIAEWKRSHRDTIKRALGVTKFSSRRELRAFVEPLLGRNRSIFDAFSPKHAYHENPEAEEARVWRRKMVSQIIPNNQAILIAIDFNRDLATPSERETIELFRQHVDDLVERHLGENRSVASRFPGAMESIFTGG